MTEARNGSSDARVGVLETAPGDVRTPAFVPLATKATVKGLMLAEVAERMAPGEFPLKR
jgi:queuine tRNA-ribosyltransferase